MSEPWDELLTVALLGTARRAPNLHAPDPALQALLARLDAADAEGALLGAAALLAQYRAAGALPAPPEARTLSPAPAEEQPICPARAQPHLHAILGGSHRALLPEWLAALEAGGWRVPPGVLPELLEQGRLHAELRTAIVPALGARGRWLASLNPAWAYAAPLPDMAALDEQALAEAWDTGTRAARLALLAELRPRAPALARELLARDWASEKADDRAASLAALEPGLSIADEPLLERALDDRSKDVRRAAAALLVRLPDSQLVARMRARATGLLTLATDRAGLLGRRVSQHLHAEPPAQCDAAMQRDGIDPQPPASRQKQGERAWWLQGLLGAVPPATWSNGWGRGAPDLIALAERSEWKAALLDGWRAAALHFRDADWAEALLRHNPAEAELLAVLPPARQEALLLDILRGDCTPLHKHPVLDLLRATRHTWSPALARAVLRTLHRHMRGWRDSYDYQLRGALTDEVARRLPPALLPEIANGWPNDPGVRERWQGVIDKLLITLQFRHDMLRELGR